MQISLLHIKSVTEILEIEKRIEVATSIFTLVDKIHLVPTLEISIEKMRVVCSIYKLCMRTVVEQTDDELH